MWLPNEQRMSFRWVFQHALPTLLPAHAHNRVRLLMKDGDAQQRNKLLQVILPQFPNAQEGSCGYHIGWCLCQYLLQFCCSPPLTTAITSVYSSVENMKKYVTGMSAMTTQCQSLWKGAVLKIKQWIYSWMRPGYVESDDEYKISKYLLLQFVCSATVLRAASGQIPVVVALLRFIQGHVFVHEHLYLHYTRQFLRHFDVSHASPHEVRNV